MKEKSTRMLDGYDHMAPNAGPSDGHAKSYAHIGDMSGMREQTGYKVSGLHIDGIGEQTTAAKTSHPKPQEYAAEQMSDGSMGYLKTKDEQASDDAKKIKRHEVPYIKY